MVVGTALVAADVDVKELLAVAPSPDGLRPLIESLKMNLCLYFGDV